MLFDPFQVIPSTYAVGPSFVTAFLYTGNSLPRKIDVLCDCSTSISDLECISIDSSANTITIQTSNSNYIGSYTIVLVQTIKNFPDVKPNTSFNFRLITEPVVTQSTPPYFKHDLTT
jgi:hypothetical protein